MQTGVLAGTTPDQAYFVTCDSTNNTSTTVAQGVVNVQVGVAVQSPAEFIVIEIGQYSGSTSATDSTATS
jgi:phage tail sheath protein FI